jgi:aminomethyltransferase
MSDSLLRTPLHGEHAALGAKLVPFAGFEMPVQYPAGITAEHHAVRRGAGLFDVSHMGEFEVRGEGAEPFLQALVTNDVSSLEVGQAQYNLLLRDGGGIIDDLIVYRLADRWMLVVNGANRAKDWEWVSSRAAAAGVEVADRSDEIALLALQGPRAQELLAGHADLDLDPIGYYRFAEGRVAGVEALVSRTGYTGEDGFELYVAAGDAVALWRALLEGGDVQPAGLGCRDSLRLEMGYALYGNDLDESRNPYEAGLGWVVKPAKGDFAGRDAILRAKEEGIAQKLTGFRLLERGFPRAGYGVWHDGREVCTVTSGVLSPTLGEGIGLAYLPAGLSAPGTEIQLMVRDRPLRAVTARPPFHTSGSVRR